MVRRVYLEAMLTLPDVLEQYGKRPWFQPVLAALTQLREVALRQRPSVDEPQKQGQLRAELAERQVIQEFEFTSSTPGIGPAVAALRRAWNSVSTKWYVRAIIQQQMAFNALVARLLSEEDIQAEASASDIGLLANELTTLRQKLETDAANIRKDMRQLQLRLSRIEQLLTARNAESKAVTEEPPSE